MLGTFLASLSSDRKMQLNSWQKEAHHWTGLTGSGRTRAACVRPISNCRYCRVCCYHCYDCSFIWIGKRRKQYQSKLHAMEFSRVDIVEGLLVPLKCKTTGTITATATTNTRADNSTILTKWIMYPYSNRFFRTEVWMNCEGSRAKERKRSFVLFKTSVRRSFALSNDDEETLTRGTGSQRRKNKDICCSEKRNIKMNFST